VGENSKIEWTDATHNFWIGCTEVSHACDYCYARTMSERYGWAKWGNHPRHLTSDANWRKPLMWNHKAEGLGVRYKVFANSLSDFFDNQVPEEWRERAWGIIEKCHYLDFLLLTKRPQNIAKMLPHTQPWPFDNVWLGTTVENQEEADRRIPHLLAVPAAKRFLSCEPLLGPLMLWGWDEDEGALRGPGVVQHGGMTVGTADNPSEGYDDSYPGIDWVIAGGESGHHARPMHPDWARSLRDQCAAAGVPFFFKQIGEWVAESQTAIDLAMHDFRQCTIGAPTRDGCLHRVGKKLAGALLDGVEHRGMPG
jgi:protein gp37